MRKEQISDLATIYLGDCRDILPELKSGSIDFIFTDPPYGHNNNGGGDLISKRERALGKGIIPGKSRPIVNDGVEADDLIKWLFSEANRLLVAGGVCCCCGGGGGPDPQFARWSLWLDSAIGFKQMVVWDKGPMGMGWHYRRSYETVLVGEKSGAPCRWFDKTNRIENIIRPGSGIGKIIPSEQEHPTLKPVSLSSHFINLHTDVEHTVLDPCMGSGTTGVSAVSLGRQFIGIEYDLVHFDTASRRIANTSPNLFQQRRVLEKRRKKPSLFDAVSKAI
jgi:site-specific DNA-methyltransferase (adenine-specific)